MRSALLEALSAGEPAMEAVCRKVGVSPRTLQRTLIEEGRSFQQTLDASRNSRAHYHLHNSAI